VAAPGRQRRWARRRTPHIDLYVRRGDASAGRVEWWNPRRPARWRCGAGAAAAWSGWVWRAAGARACGPDLGRVALGGEVERSSCRSAGLRCRPVKSVLRGRGAPAGRPALGPDWARSGPGLMLSVALSSVLRRCRCTRLARRAAVACARPAVAVQPGVHARSMRGSGSLAGSVLLAARWCWRPSLPPAQDAARYEPVLCGVPVVYSSLCCSSGLWGGH
jgi:hypothetical protein